MEAGARGPNGGRAPVKGHVAPADGSGGTNAGGGDERGGHADETGASGNGPETPPMTDGGRRTNPRGHSMNSATNGGSATDGGSGPNDANATTTSGRDGASGGGPRDGETPFSTVQCVEPPAASGCEVTGSGANLAVRGDLLTPGVVYLGGTLRI